MRLRSQTHTALRALLDLSLNAAYQVPVPLSDIARRQGLSGPFLEQLFRQLKQADLVAPWRGMKGGYTLKRDAAEISLLQVCEALAEPATQPMAKAGAQAAPEEEVLRLALARAEEAQRDALSKISLADLRRDAQKHPRLSSTPRTGAGFTI